MSQVFFLAIIGEFSFYGLFRCPFAVPYVNCGNCPVIQCPGRDLWIPVWIGLLASGLLFGRSFCSWACPGGLVSEIIGKLAIVRTKTKSIIESYSKYLVIAASLVVFFLLNNPRWAIPIRTGDFFQSVSLTFEHANQLWLWRTGFVTGGIAMALIIPHFWCKYLCPTGGIMELLNKVAIFKYLKTSDCNDCNVCQKGCMAETRPDEVNCVGCGDCKPACRIGAIKFGRGDKKTEGQQAMAA